MPDDTGLTIDGYASPLSVKAGEPIGFHISTTADTFSIQIARIGRDRLSVWSRAGLKGSQYDVAEHAYAHGCRWPISMELKVPVDWSSGYYHVQLQGEDSAGHIATGQMFFVVRSAHRGDDLD